MRWKGAVYVRKSERESAGMLDDARRAPGERSVSEGGAHASADNSCLRRVGFHNGQAGHLFFTWVWVKLGVDGARALRARWCASLSFDAHTSVDADL